MSSSAATTENVNNNSEQEQQPVAEQPVEEQQQQPTVTPAADATSSSFNDYFNKLLERYGEDYVKKVVDAAKQESFTITLRKPTGRKVPDPLEPEKEIEEYEGYETKPYKVYPISPLDYHRYEKLRATFDKEKEPDKVIDNQARIYQFLAYCYLGMSYSDFARVADWNEIKLAVDASLHGTVYQLDKKQKRV